MNIGDYYWGLYSDYYRDPFPHSLLSTRQTRTPRLSPIKTSGFRFLWGFWLEDEG